ncbi:MAG: TonB-dependent siderophore receptor [Acetobacteraceae bacterium]|nr:TonB-dependent siderophore receptor [Acetobacteraceae bacterium]
MLLATTGLIALGALPVPAEAQQRQPAAVAQAAPTAPTYGFAIPAGPLPGALNAFGRTTGLSVLFTQAEAAGAQSPGVSGSMTAEAALARLLAGTGWSHRFADARTVTLARATTPDGAVALPEVRVQAGLILPQATIGPPPPAFAGGQVGTGGRVGLLGNRSVFDTPFSQTNYTEQLIRDQQARSLPDLLANDPSVRITLPRYGEQDNFFVRGFRLDPGDILFDGLPGLVDVRRPALEGFERVEVLRGPNTLLSGIAPNGNIGGLINVVPKRAGETPITRLTGRYASDSTFGGAVDVGRRFGPGGEVGVRLNAALDDGDTPIDGQSRLSRFVTLGTDVRLPNFRASLDVTYQDQDIQRPNRILLANPGFAIPAAPSARASWQQPWETYSSSFSAAVARAEYDLSPDVTLFGAFGIARFEDNFFSGTSRLLNNRGDIILQPQLQAFDFDQQSAEFGARARFATGPVRHELVAAAAGYWRTVFSAPTSNIGTPISSNIYRPVIVPPRSSAGLDGITRRSSEADLTSIALADTLSILDGRVQLLLGARLQQVQTDNFNIATGSRTSSYDRSAVTPTIGLTIRPWEQVSLYASYIEGLAPGPTAPQTVRNAGEVFAPTISRQYEVGAKFDFGSFGASLALFQITQPSGIVDPTGNVFTVDGEQRNRGVELSVFGAVSEDLRVLGGVAFLDGEQTATAGGRNDGKTAVGTPRVQMNIGGEYDLRFLPGLTAQARVIHTSSQFYDAANTQSIPAWTRLDLGARYRFRIENTQYTARFNVENVTGADYWQSAGRGFLTLGAPRTFLFSLTADF